MDVLPSESSVFKAKIDLLGVLFSFSGIRVRFKAFSSSWAAEKKFWEV